MSRDFSCSEDKRFDLDPPSRAEEDFNNVDPIIIGAPVSRVQVPIPSKDTEWTPSKPLGQYGLQSS